ncbi:MAG: hypothetical protein PUB42_01795 [Firmicutes bacterium]|nr:hypothetical protein [Bacillota bacterium]
MEFFPYIKDKPLTLSKKSMGSPEFARWWCTLESAAVQNFYQGCFTVTFHKKQSGD